MTVKAFQEPSPSDWDRWIERLLNGQEPSEAAKAEGQTCSAFRRQDAGRHGEALQVSREIRAGADRELVRDKLREVTAQTDHPQWAKSAELLGRSADMFGDTQRVEITGGDGGPVQVERREVSLHGVLHILARAGALDDVDLGVLAGAREVLPARSE